MPDHNIFDLFFQNALFNINRQAKIYRCRAGLLISSALDLFDEINFRRANLLGLIDSPDKIPERYLYVSSPSINLPEKLSYWIRRRTLPPDIFLLTLRELPRVRLRPNLIYIILFNTLQMLHAAQLQNNYSEETMQKFVILDMHNDHVEISVMHSSKGWPDKKSALNIAFELPNRLIKRYLKSYRASYKIAQKCIAEKDFFGVTYAFPKRSWHSLTE